MLGMLGTEGMGLVNSMVTQSNTENLMASQEGYLTGNMVRAPGLQKAGMIAAGFNPMLMAGPQSPFGGMPMQGQGANPAVGQQAAASAMQAASQAKLNTAQADNVTAQAAKTRAETLNPGEYSANVTGQTGMYQANAQQSNANVGYIDAQTAMVPTQIKKLQSDIASNWATVDKTNQQAINEFITNSFLPKTIDIQNQLNKANTDYARAGIPVREAESKVAGLVGQGVDAINGAVDAAKKFVSGGNISDGIDAVQTFLKNPASAWGRTINYATKLFAGDN